jgi:hypothetical protein
MSNRLENCSYIMRAKSLLGQVEIAGRTTGIEIQPVIMVGGPDEIDATFAALAREAVDAVVVQGTAAFSASSRLFGLNSEAKKARTKQSSANIVRRR